MKRRLFLLSTIVALPLAGRPAAAETVRVFAAASLAEAFKEIGAIYERERKGDRIEFNFAGSQVLRTQIEQGAPFDVFASADLVHMKALLGKKEVHPYKVFAHNRLAVVVPKGRAKVVRLSDLAKPGVKIVTAGPTVPAGRYANAALTKMGRSPSYGPGFVAKVKANVVSRETNVRAVLSKVALGEADAGIVYVTDAAAMKGSVTLIPIPGPLNVTAAYPMAASKSSTKLLKIALFMAEVTGKKGQAILRKHGFQP